MAAQLSEAIARIKGTIKGRVLTADDANYDEARQIWNAMINRRPDHHARVTHGVPGDIGMERIKEELQNGQEQT